MMRKLLVFSVAFAGAAHARPAYLEIPLVNPQSAPAGLPADLRFAEGSIVCASESYPLLPEMFDFGKNRARLPVISGERCTVLISSMTLTMRGSNQLVTYRASDKPFLLPLSLHGSDQPLVAPAEVAVSFDLLQTATLMPPTLWFAAYAAGSQRVVGIDVDRTLAIKNVQQRPAGLTKSAVDHVNR